MEEISLRNHFARVPMGGSVAAPAAPAAGDGQIAIVPIIGPITKYGSCWGGCSALEVKENIRAALENQTVSTVLIYVDSPGGTVDGTTDLADYLASITEKPVWVYISDNCLSALYWAASQCDRVIANRAARVGSIGIYRVLVDSSKQAADAGVSVTVVKQGNLKGAGEPGTPVTPEAVNEAQREVNDIYDLFVDAVATGREMSRAEVLAVADGRVLIAGDALNAKLIDGIATLEETIAAIQNGGIMAADQKAPEKKTDTTTTESTDDSSKRMTAMESDIAAIKAAILKQNVDDNDDDASDASAAAKTAPMKAANDRLSQIMAAVGNRADFAVTQFLAGADPLQAKAALADLLSKENETLRKNANVEKKPGEDGSAPLALGTNADGTTGESADQLWARNADGVQEKYRGKKDHFIAFKKYEAKQKK